MRQVELFVILAVHLRLFYVPSIASIYQRIKSDAGRVDRIGNGRFIASPAASRRATLVRGCVLRRAKITSSLAADINLFGREIRDQVDLAYFVRFGGFCLLSLLSPTRTRGRTCSSAFMALNAEHAWTSRSVLSENRCSN